MIFRNLICILLASSLVCCQSVPPNKGTKLSIRTTAYTQTENDHLKFGSQTAIGTTLRVGVCAADWSILPVGTVIQINGNNFVVEDYGHYVIKASKSPIPTIDIYQPSKADMRDWGLRFYDNVEIVKWGSYQKSIEYLKNNLHYAHCRLMYDRIKDKL